MKYLYIILIFYPVILFADNSMNKINEAENYVKMLCSSLNLFRLDSRRYPTTEEGLMKLLEPKLNDEGIAGQPYLYQIEADPWGNQYQYFVNNNVIKVWSMGPDGLSDSVDDIGKDICN